MKILQSNIGLKPFKNSLLMDLEEVRIDIFEKNIIFPIIKEGRYWSDEVKKYDSKKFKQSKFKPFDVRHWQNTRMDIGLLVNDEKFYKILKTVRNSLDNCYNIIIKQRNRDT